MYNVAIIAPKLLPSGKSTWAMTLLCGLCKICTVWYSYPIWHQIHAIRKFVLVNGPGPKKFYREPCVGQGELEIYCSSCSIKQQHDASWHRAFRLQYLRQHKLDEELVHAAWPRQRSCAPQRAALVRKARFRAGVVRAESAVSNDLFWGAHRRRPPPHRRPWLTQVRRRHAAGRDGALLQRPGRPGARRRGQRRPERAGGADSGSVGKVPATAEWAGRSLFCFTAALRCLLGFLRRMQVIYG